MNSNISNKLFAAVVAKFQAQRLEAEANLNGILFNSVNVADHVNLVDEVCKAVRMLAEAEGALAAIERNVNVNRRENQESD